MMIITIKHPMVQLFSGYYLESIDSQHPLIKYVRDIKKIHHILIENLLNITIWI
ncbi:protein of unknown function [Xenorhabdus poinarii G6]|uniref:Uncharacterized protein n=1 Tax=Xenorhabdus poinarii G6 TaxID=1354304 RepID=A0A068R4C6_9GAMM|nr:protein of unknown function [Xenorhabdus poinarii G6]